MLRSRVKVNREKMKNCCYAAADGTKVKRTDELI